MQYKILTVVYFTIFNKCFDWWMNRHAYKKYIPRNMVICLLYELKYAHDISEKYKCNLVKKTTFHKHHRVYGTEDSSATLFFLLSHQSIGLAKKACQSFSVEPEELPT